MSKLDLNTDEKIDLIYNMLDKQESRYKKNLIWKWVFRVLIIWFIVSFYTIILPKLDITEIIKEYIAPRMSQIIAPMAAESMKSMTTNMMSWELNLEENSDVNQAALIQKKAELLKRLKEMQNK
jgi:uncharacterized membrane protein